MSEYFLQKYKIWGQIFPVFRKFRVAVAVNLLEPREFSFSKGFFCCTFVTTSLKHLQKSFGCSYMKGQAILAIGGR